MLRPLKQDSAHEYFVARWATPTALSCHLVQTIRSWLSTRKLSRVTLLDIFERAVVVLVFGHFAFVMLNAPGRSAGILGIILFVSESLPVFLDSHQTTVQGYV